MVSNKILVSESIFWSIRTHEHLKLNFGQFVLNLVNSYSFQYEYELTKWVRIDQNGYETDHDMSTNWPNEYELTKIWVRIDQNEYELTWVRIDQEPCI